MRDSTALVTGSAAGIGRTFAQQLAARGHDLVLVDRDGPGLEATAGELRRRHGVDVEALVADLTDRQQLARVEERLASTDRPVDLLVNNAGFGLKGRFGDNDVEAEQAMLDVLVVAVMRLNHAALGAMSARGRGGVVNVSSVAAFLPRGTYSAAKAYVNAFGRWAAAEYRPRGVTVTTVCPGFTWTDFHARMGLSRDSAPDFMWLDADRMVREALADHDAGKVLSVPSRRYRLLVRMARLLPSHLLQESQSVGRS